MNGPGRTQRRKNRIESVLKCRQDDLTVILGNIHDSHNVSAIYRTCDAFGVSRVVLYYTHEAFPALHRKTSASARKWVDTVRIDDPEALAEYCRQNKFQILATSFAPEAVSLWHTDFLKPSAIILGNEHSGVDAELLRLADQLIYIPMAGMIQSLNVSVAAAVLLAEAARQRRLAGFYDQCRLGEAEFIKKRSQWLEK